MVTEKKRRSRYTSVAWCTTVRDANSARPDAAASNHAMDVVKLAQDASIHGQHVIDLRVVHRRARVPPRESENVQPEKQPLEGGSERIDSLAQSWDLEAPGSELAYDNFDDFIRLTERQLFQPDHQSDIHGANPRSEGFVSSKLDSLSAQGITSPHGVLNAVDQSFWCQVLAIYEEEVGMMYPFLDINQLSHEIIEKPTQSYSDYPHSSSHYGESIANIAFLVLAIVSSFEGSKSVEIVSPVVEEAFVSTIPKIYLQSPGLGDLTLLSLICIFFFLNDREKEAWRLIGTIMRLVHEQSSQEEQNPAEKISDDFFWSLYTLDRRWSFGTGLPFAVQDSEVNRPSLPTNDSSHSSAYLKEMVSFCGIASDVRSFFLGTFASRLQDSNSTQDYLQFRVLQWQQNLPRRLQFNGIDDKFDMAIEKRGHYKLRLMLYLRANQMRTIILRKAASRFGSHNIDTSNFEVMIQVARDTIQVLARLARETDIYHAQHKTFNHFLETALSSLLLVTCYASPDQSKSCLQDVVAATQLIHRLARESPITMRLRDKLQTIRKATDELRSQRYTGSGEGSGSVPGTGATRVEQASGLSEAAHAINLTGDPILLNGLAATANIPVGLFDIDAAETTWVDTDPSMFNNLSQILGNCEGFTFF
ncbi:fungal specific transcription factor factor [Fusarium denticulatum]|uniref:Fungal specific transcription factor factor n=1 Tax=Fusarium denticulatum TaxID=48507 RepID=A0A8H5TGY0_9HYPO|nr:fungal specific transcription factor factor [Fusarium denticulatum]